MRIESPHSDLYPLLCSSGCNIHPSFLEITDADRSGDARLCHPIPFRFSRAGICMFSENRQISTNALRLSRAGETANEQYDGLEYWSLGSKHKNEQSYRTRGVICRLNADQTFKRQLWSMVLIFRSGKACRGVGLGRD